jgi:membrane-associated protease RseP (regulator of RpoE activity)
MSMNFLRGSTASALMAALVFGSGAIGQAQAAEEEAQGGPVVQIGQADEGTATPNNHQEERVIDQTAPKYWIGLGVGVISPDHVLRAFVDIPEKQGLLVATVAKGSPAEKAGLKPHDILLRANDTDLHELSNLTDLVAAEGAKKGQIAIEVLRKSGRETVYVTPEDRPAEAQRPQFGGDDSFGGFGANGLPQELLQQFRGRGPVEFRNFGPGVILGEGQGITNVPNGVSVNIQKEGDKPAKITVQRGEEKWTVSGDDEESLKQLPEDLRPFVEQMLHGNSIDQGGVGLGQMPDFGDGRLRERLERMEKQMQQMLERMNQDHQDHPAAKDAEKTK